MIQACFIHSPKPPTWKLIATLVQIELVSFSVGFGSFRVQAKNADAAIAAAEMFAARQRERRALVA